MEKENGKGEGPKYWLDIEGQEKPWNSDTITTEEIIALGGWTLNLGAIEVNLKDNTERPLQPNEIVQIKPGHGFGKRILYKRG